MFGGVTLLGIMIGSIVVGTIDSGGVVTSVVTIVKKIINQDKIYK